MGLKPPVSLAASYPLAKANGNGYLVWQTTIENIGNIYCRQF